MTVTIGFCTNRAHFANGTYHRSLSMSIHNIPQFITMQNIVGIAIPYYPQSVYGYSNKYVEYCGILHNSPHKYEYPQYSTIITFRISVPYFPRRCGPVAQFLVRPRRVVEWEIGCLQKRCCVYVYMYIYII